MKQKRYWLRGGIILVILVTIIEIIFGMLGTPALSIPGLFVALGVTHCPLLNSWSGNNPEYCKPVVISLAILINFVFYFVVGSYFGRLYGWIKGRKQADTTTN